MKNNILNKVKQFIEGNFNMLQDDLLGKPTYYKEQIYYRTSKCSDCYVKGKCKQCGCSLPGKHYVTKSCNPERFPDLMTIDEWEKYKKDNDINIDLDG